MSPSLVDMFSPLYVTERVLAEVGTTATLGEVQTTKVAMAAELEKSRKAKINITNSRKTEGRPNTLDRKADAESSNTSNSSSSSSSRSSSTNPSAQPSSGSKNSSTELAKTSPRAGSLDLELELKHPLENAWTLWFFKNDRSKKWEEMQSPVLTVRTVEDFWSLYHHIELASLLPAGTDYSLFKEGIFPDWEDRRNKEGGRWDAVILLIIGPGFFPLKSFSFVYPQLVVCLYLLCVQRFVLGIIPKSHTLSTCLSLLSYHAASLFSKHRPSGPMLSLSQNVHISVCLSVCLFVCLSVHF